MNRKKIDWSLYEGPTKNVEYNYAYAMWQSIGYDDLPRCEDCDCDTTGLDVFETYIGWYCFSCYEKSDDSKLEEIHNRLLSEEELIESRTSHNWSADREDFHSDG